MLLRGSFPGILNQRVLFSVKSLFSCEWEMLGIVTQVPERSKTRFTYNLPVQNVAVEARWWRADRNDTWQHRSAPVCVCCLHSHSEAYVKITAWCAIPSCERADSFILSQSTVCHRTVQQRVLQYRRTQHEKVHYLSSMLRLKSTFVYVSVKPIALPAQHQPADRHS